jgi:hypothetical protein
MAQLYTRSQAGTDSPETAYLGEGVGGGGGRFARPMRISRSSRGCHGFLDIPSLGIRAGYTGCWKSSTVRNPRLVQPHVRTLLFTKDRPAFVPVDVSRILRTRACRFSCPEFDLYRTADLIESDTPAFVPPLPQLPGNSPRNRAGQISCGSLPRLLGSKYSCLMRPLPGRKPPWRQHDSASRIARFLIVTSELVPSAGSTASSVLMRLKSMGDRMAEARPSATSETDHAVPPRTESNRLLCVQFLELVQSAGSARRRIREGRAEGREIDDPLRVPSLSAPSRQTRVSDSGAFTLPPASSRLTSVTHSILGRRSLRSRRFRLSNFHPASVLPNVPNSAGVCLQECNRGKHCETGLYDSVLRRNRETAAETQDACSM